MRAQPAVIRLEPQIHLLSTPVLLFRTVTLIYDDAVATNPAFLHQLLKVVQQGRGHVHRSTCRTQTEKKPNSQ